MVQGGVVKVGCGEDGVSHTPKTQWQTPPYTQRQTPPAPLHAGINTATCGQADTCENITLPQTSFTSGKKMETYRKG